MPLLTIETLIIDPATGYGLADGPPRITDRGTVSWEPLVCLGCGGLVDPAFSVRHRQRCPRRALDVDPLDGLELEALP